jgi:hypothetical protein
MALDDRYHMNQLSKGASHGYQLGTELNKIQADFASVISQSNTKALSACGLAEGTNDATIQIGTTLLYMIDGTLYAKAATDNIATGSADAQTAGTGVYCAYTASLNASGTLSMVKGTEGSSAAAALAGATGESGKAPIGVVVVQSDASTFTLGTDDLSTTDCESISFYDLIGASDVELTGGVTATFTALT